MWVWAITNGIRAKHRTMWQRGSWTPKRGGFGGGPTSIGERNECLWGCWSWREWIVRSISVGEENETPFTRVWKLLPSRRVLKTFRVNPKGKVQRRQYLLVVGLNRYSFVFSTNWRFSFLTSSLFQAWANQLQKERWVGKAFGNYWECWRSNCDHSL